MTEKEKSHAEMLYQPGDPELVSDRDTTIKKLYDYNIKSIRPRCTVNCYTRVVRQDWR